MTRLISRRLLIPLADAIYRGLRVGTVSSAQVASYCAVLLAHCRQLLVPQGFTRATKSYSYIYVFANIIYVFVLEFDLTKSPVMLQQFIKIFQWVYIYLYIWNRKLMIGIDYNHTKNHHIYIVQAQVTNGKQLLYQEKVFLQLRV